MKLSAASLILVQLAALAVAQTGHVSNNGPGGVGSYGSLAKREEPVKLEEEKKEEENKNGEKPETKDTSPRSFFRRYSIEWCAHDPGNDDFEKRQKYCLRTLFVDPSKPAPPPPPRAGECKDMDEKLVGEQKAGWVDTGEMCCGGFSGRGCKAEAFLFMTAKWKGAFEGSEFKDADKKVESYMCLHSTECGPEQEKLFKAPEKVMGGVDPGKSVASALGASMVAILVCGLFSIVMASL